jgi:hypothetical protein
MVPVAWSSINGFRVRTYAGGCLHGRARARGGVRGGDHGRAAESERFVGAGGHCFLRVLGGVGPCCGASNREVQGSAKFTLSIFVMPRL